MPQNHQMNHPPVRRRKKRRKFRREFLILVWSVLALLILIPLCVHFIRAGKKAGEDSSASEISSSVSSDVSGMQSSEPGSKTGSSSDTEKDTSLIGPASPEDFTAPTEAERQLAAGKETIEAIAQQMAGIDTLVLFCTAVTEGHPYLAAVNRAGNTVTIYTDDGSGNYYKPFLAMVCSAGGENTPRGVWEMPTSEESPSRPVVRALWHLLDGNVYGQYISRITPNDGILFHSVPYTTNGEKDSLEYEEFNKLGKTASAGCIRLSVTDAKWVYDNLPFGTMVVIYDDAENPGPLGQPGTITIDESDTARRGWDPTDPDSENPWGSVESTMVFGDGVQTVN